MKLIEGKLAHLIKESSEEEGRTLGRGEKGYEISRPKGEGLRATDKEIGED